MYKQLTLDMIFELVQLSLRSCSPLWLVEILVDNFVRTFLQLSLFQATFTCYTNLKNQSEVCYRLVPKTTVMVENIITKSPAVEYVPKRWFFFFFPLKFICKLITCMLELASHALVICMAFFKGEGEKIYP